MSDVIEVLGKSVVQHGNYNDRVYLMKLAKEDLPSIVNRLDHLAKTRGYSKILAKVPSFAKEVFTSNGYIAEAHLPDFFNGQDDAYFMGKYLSKQRINVDNNQVLDEVLTVAQEKSTNEGVVELPNGYKFKRASKQDAEPMAELYRQVFKTYPFPIFDPDYIKQTMDDNLIYFAVCQDSEIVALSSAEMDIAAQNNEMTDFATHPEYRGQNLSVYLLTKMEAAMSKEGIKTAYTIARGESFGMNITFAKLGYRYGGTLKNNTNISGSLESMNVWYKKLSADRW